MGSRYSASTESSRPASLKDGGSAPIARPRYTQALMPAGPGAYPRPNPEAIRTYMKQARLMAEKTRQAVARALAQSRTLQKSADAAIQRAEARLKWVRDAKQRLDDRVR